MTKLKHVFFLVLTSFNLSLLLNTSVFAEGCVPSDWDGHWSATIQKCYSDTVSSQFDHLTHYFRKSEIENLRALGRSSCIQQQREFGGELAEQFYWDCLTTSLQSKIDQKIAQFVAQKATYLETSWDLIDNCTVTYFKTSIETKVGSYLMGKAGWLPENFPKTVMDGDCQVVADRDKLVVYEGSKDWEPGRYFFYVSVFDEYPVSIHSQPEPTSSHSQWPVTEFAELIMKTPDSGCFASSEIEICFSSKSNMVNK